jgi:hypothetical protein
MPSGGAGGIGCEVSSYFLRKFERRQSDFRIRSIHNCLLKKGGQDKIQSDLARIGLDSRLEISSLSTFSM